MVSYTQPLILIYRPAPALPRRQNKETCLARIKDVVYILLVTPSHENHIRIMLNILQMLQKQSTQISNHKNDI